ncbi:D-isomer specific 2-hydroxyacid dehydrogenase [Russula vinacea]|nr:D-isomer specific 2-hydroxyacid dehydrogenase [Russula vinacea]
MIPPRVLFCGDLVWAHEEAKQLLHGLAEVLPFRESQAGGKVRRTVAIYRANESAEHVGIFDRALIDALPPTVRWIAHNGAGYDPIDVKACKEKGIIVSNTPIAVDDATATTALYLMISTFRHFSKGERSLRATRWKSDVSSSLTHDLTGKTLAILGLGGIGFRLAELARAFPMRIIYHSRKEVLGAPDWCEYFGQERLEEFLGLADVLSVHVPLRPDTEGLVNEKMIRKLKKGAILVNTARGKIIDEAALIKALEDGHLGAVGLDVYPNEPAVNPRLLDFPNATLLPHMGTETCDTQRKMEVRALTNLRDYLVKGKGSDVVPELKDLCAKL